MFACGRSVLGSIPTAGVPYETYPLDLVPPGPNYIYNMYPPAQIILYRMYPRGYILSR